MCWPGHCARAPAQAYNSLGGRLGRRRGREGSAWRQVNGIEAARVPTEAAELGGQNLWPFLIYSLAVALVCGVTIGISWLLGTRTRRRKATDQPYESGIIAVGEADQVRFSIEFYLIAMFFVLFDLETIFIFGWAVAFFELGWPGYVGASVFILILLVALVYEWRTGALDWGRKRRQPPGGYALAERQAAPAQASS